MNQQTNDPQRPLRLFAALLAAVIAVAALWWFAGQSGRMDVVKFFYLERLAAIACSLLILAGALGYGLQILRALRVNASEASERLVYAVGVGLGLLAILVLALGLLGGLQITLWAAILLAGIAIGAKEIYRLGRELWAGIAEAARRPSFATLIWVIIGLCFILNLTPAFVPVWEYDMQEYHLGVPAQFCRAGKIFNVTDNVYAAFPENVENLYLLNMVLNGSTRGGAESAIVLNAILALLAAVAVRGLGRRLFASASSSQGGPSANAGDYAAAIFYLWPAVTTQLSSAYVEAGLIFYSVTAALALSHVLANRERHTPRREAYAWAALCGLMTGLAIGVKYPAAAFLLVPIGILLFGDLVIAGDRRRKLIVLIVWSLGVLVAWGPWLIRNFMWYDNPVYPLLYSLFGGQGWDAVKEAKWTHAHGPGEMTLSAFGLSLKETFFSAKDVSPLLFLFIPFIILCARKAAKAVLLLVGYCALFLILWFAFTHRIERFAQPVMPFLAVLSGAGAWYLRGLLPRALPVIFVVLLILEPARLVCYAYAAQSFSDGLVSEQEYFADKTKTDFSEIHAAMQFIGETMRGDVKILFIGEARTFYCEKPFVAPTVFNDQPIEKAVANAKDADDVYRALREQGFTHLLINTEELIRLQDPTKAYGYTLDGKEHLGMLDGFNWELFGGFAERHLKLLKQVFIFGGPQANPWPDYNWYQWHVARQKTKTYPALFVGVYELVP